MTAYIWNMKYFIVKKSSHVKQRSGVTYIVLYFVY